MEKNKNKKVLLIDDDLFLLDMYSLKFKESGFDLEIAQNGEEALAKLENKEYLPRVILLDLLMPSMDGVSFLKIIKEKNIAEGVKVIALSNLSQKDEIERVIGLGAADFIVKAHHTPSEVVEKVKRLLE